MITIPDRVRRARVHRQLLGQSLPIMSVVPHIAEDDKILRMGPDDTVGCGGIAAALAVTVGARPLRFRLGDLSADGRG